MDVVIKLLVAGGVMGLMDFLWLGYVAKKLYYGEMGALLLKKFNTMPALLFYAIYVVGTIIFVVNPALEKSSWQHALGYGALFGFATYATYDLTNLATLKGFSTKVVVVDLLWGTFLTAVVCVLTYLAMKGWV